MRQRIGLAQALLHEPEVLILDEPTIGLDPAQVVEVRNLVRQIGKERTVLLSTPVLSEAQQLCDEIVIVDAGKVIAKGGPTQLVDDADGCDDLESLFLSLTGKQLRD